MGFSPTLREDAIVRSARRCCVCREYKGLGIEVHHIRPSSEGGPDTIENAIVLCFDCHAAAGHYNPSHPRGSRFSPSELRRHRDRLWGDVERGLIPPANPAAADIHVRHLLCLDYEKANTILTGGFVNKEFSARNVIQNQVSRFMRRVLHDDLPLTEGSLPYAGTPTPGFLLREEWWETRGEAAQEYPEFATADSRPIEARDLADGHIRSRLFAMYVAAGMPPGNLGTLQLEDFACGEKPWLLEYRIRRPLPLFSEISNRGTAPIVVTALRGFRCAAAQVPQELNSIEGELVREEIPPITLGPGEGLIVPAGVLLSPAADDDLSFEWIERWGDDEPFDYVGYSDDQSRQGAEDYLEIGPSFRLKSVEAMIGGLPASIDAHDFDVRRVYVAGVGFMGGSCPYAVAETETGELFNIGEILVDAWGSKGSTVLRLPPNATRLHICEFEVEITEIDRVDGVDSAELPVALERGDILSLEVTGLSEVCIHGGYRTSKRHPTSSEERRFKRGLVSGGLRRLDSGLRRAKAATLS